MPETPRKTYRFKPHILAIARAISEAREGLTETQVFENAIEHYGRKVLGRRMADLVSPRVRPGRRRTMPD
jgi:hypothetical protein